jgi:hypothetical protein
MNNISTKVSLCFTQTADKEGKELFELTRIAPQTHAQSRTENNYTG